jgi:hypothetical protein
METIFFCIFQLVCLIVLVYGWYQILKDQKKILQIITLNNSKPVPNVFPKGQVPGKVFAPGVYHIDKAHENKALDATDARPEPWTTEELTPEV